MSNHAQPLLESFPLTFRFSVVFFELGIIPNPLDIRFRKVSGITSEINTHEVNSGGENLFTRRLPAKVNYRNLTLERGFAIGSVVRLDFNAAMTGFQFAPGNVQVILYGENSLPISSWMFLNTYPVKWSISYLYANQDQLVIESMELAYDQFLSITI